MCNYNIHTLFNMSFDIRIFFARRKRIFVHFRRQAYNFDTFFCKLINAKMWIATRQICKQKRGGRNHRGSSASKILPEDEQYFTGPFSLYIFSRFVQFESDAIFFVKVCLPLFFFFFFFFFFINMLCPGYV